LGQSAAIAAISLSTAATGRFAAAYHTVNESGSTADPLVYGKCAEGTIADACPAFHAPVPVQNDRFFIFQRKDFMRTNLNAHSAADTVIREKLKACRI
jgi:hypothetical protein